MNCDPLVYNSPSSRPEVPLLRPLTVASIAISALRTAHRFSATVTSWWIDEPLRGLDAAASGIR